jgi:hypothetical protein
MLARAGPCFKTFAPVVAIFPTCRCCHGLGYLLPKIDDATLIATIADRVGARPFTVHELRHHAKVDEALRAALANLSNHQIGKALSRIFIAGDLDGYSVERIVDERAGALWQIILRE